MPDSSLWLLVLVIILAIGFGFTNGRNDTANTIATVTGTRVLLPRKAVILAALFNFAGAATGLEAARTSGKGILVPETLTYVTIIAAFAAYSHGKNDGQMPVGVVVFDIIPQESI